MLQEYLVNTGAVSINFTMQYNCEIKRERSSK
jgi:hypothetical protein